MSSNQSIKLYESLKRLTKVQFDEVCFYLQGKYGYDLSYIDLGKVPLAHSAMQLIELLEQKTDGLNHLKDVIDMTTNMTEDKELKKRTHHEIQKATVKIFADGEFQGTGFFITPDGYVLTGCDWWYFEHHFDHNIVIETSSGEKFAAQLDKDKSYFPHDPWNIVLKVDHHTPHCLPLGTVSEQHVGNEIVAIGYYHLEDDDHQIRSNFVGYHHPEDISDDHQIGTYFGRILRANHVFSIIDIDVDDSVRMYRRRRWRWCGQLVYHYETRRVIGIGAFPPYYHPDDEIIRVIGFEFLFERWPELEFITRKVAEDWDERLFHLRPVPEMAQLVAAQPVSVANLIFEVINDLWNNIIQGILILLSLPIQGYRKFVGIIKNIPTLIWSANTLRKAHANLIRGEQTTVQDAAIEHYQTALEIFTPELFPHECRQAAYNLGIIFYDKGDCIQARQAFETAHQALENLWREMSKQRLATENADLYARLVYCCLDKKDKAAAFKYANAAKGRAFVDALNTVNFDIRAATQNPELNKDWNEYSQVVRRGWLAKTQRLIAPEELLNRQTALWEELTSNYPTLTATQNAPVLTIEQAYALAKDMNATLVEYYQHDKGWSAFVVTDKAVEHVSLPLVNDNLFEEIKKWIGLIENRKPIGYSQIRTRRILSEWHKAVIAPLQTYLPKSGKIIFAPFEKLHLLPVHIAFDPSTEHYLAQDYSIAFIPSLSALRVSLDQTHKKQHQFVQFQRFLNVAYPGVQDSREYDYLQEAIPAAQAIANSLTEIEVTPLYEDKATPDAFITHASGQDIIHFFGHGDFVPEHPEKSGLMLAKSWLTVQDIIAKLNLEQVRLTTLGACKTVWLTQALMTAKTQTVVTTLWNVDQDATVALFKIFYNELSEGHDPVDALNRATKIMQKWRKWQHPYYWAAFQISGLTHNLK